MILRNGLKVIFLTLLIGTLLISLGLGIVQAGADITSGRVVYYKFDEGIGNTATDSANSTNTATINGAAWTLGIKNFALQFDGNDYVSDWNFSASNAITVIASIYFDEYSNDEVIAYGGRCEEFTLYISHGNPPVSDYLASFGVKLGQGDGTWYDVYSNIALQSGAWYQIAGVFSSDGTLKIFINGMLSGSKTGLPINNLYTPSGYNPCIGAYSTPQGIEKYFRGNIDEVMIYNRALLDNEVASISAPDFPAPESPFGTIAAVALPLIAVASYSCIKQKRKKK
jgi:hypothetical protein